MNLKKVIIVTTIASLTFTLLLKIKPLLEDLLVKADFTTFQASNFSFVITNIVIITLTYIVIKTFGLTALAGISNKYGLSAPLFLLFPLYIILIGLMANFKHIESAKIYDIILLLTSCLSIGFAEEFVFRGFLQSYFIKNVQKNLLLCILVPAIIFGLLHLINLYHSKNILGTIGQVIYAIFFGVGFGALLLKTNKLYPLAIIHGLVNFVFTLDSLPNVVKNNKEELVTNYVQELVNALIPALIIFPFFIYGIYILRKVDRGLIKKKAGEV